MTVLKTNEIKILEKTTGLYVLDGGEGYQERNKPYTSERRPMFVIQYVLNGKGFYKFKDKVFRLSHGNTFIVYPTEISAWGAESEDPWRYIWVEFTGRDVCGLLEKTGFSPDNPVTDKIPQREIYPIFRNVIDTFANNEIEEVQTAAMYNLLAHYIKYHPAHNSNEQNDSAAFKLYKYMQTHYCDKSCDIDTLAKHFNISRSHLFRVFKTEFGMTPLEFMTALRLKDAKDMLISTNMSVNAIAYATGFSDTYNFTRQFSKKTGMSPSAYRKTAELKNQNGIQP